MAIIGRVHTQTVALTDGATITATPNGKNNTFTVTLAGNRTFDLVATKSVIGDTVRLILTADSTLRVVTFGLLQKVTRATIGVEASEKSIVDFEFDGTSFLETSRSGRVTDVIVPLADNATITATPNARFTFFETAALAGNRQLDFVTTTSVKEDRVLVSLLCDGSIRTITLGLKQKNAAATIVLVADEKAYIDYLFDGTDYIETSRSISAI